MDRSGRSRWTVFRSRLHSAIGYVTPRDKLLGRETEIWADRDRKLEAARELRRKSRKLDHLGTAA